jgi:hypothetical protein
VKQYTVSEPFWHQGVLQEKGDKLRLTDAAAKYHLHLLEEVKDEGPAPEPKPEDYAKAEGAPSVEQAPAARDGADPEAVAQAAKIVASIKARKA